MKLQDTKTAINKKSNSMEVKSAIDGINGDNDRFFEKGFTIQFVFISVITCPVSVFVQYKKCAFALQRFDRNRNIGS